MTHEIATTTADGVWDAGAVTDFNEGVVRLVELDGISIGVVLWKGQAFAMRNVCPHMNAPICEGHVLGQIGVNTETRVVELAPDEPVVICPWHRWEFRLSDGSQLVESRQRIKTYRAEVVDARVVVHRTRKEDRDAQQELA